ncbi:MAG: tyrosine-type recombinase/integrase [Anaerolineae bacterium]|nr:tyrosine-type recombinase/integrase [Anaerolineae bacterium]
MKISELIDDYKTYLKHERGLVAQTITSYTNDIITLIRIVGDKEPCELTLTDLRAYVQHLSGLGYARATIRRRIHGLNAWYVFLVLAGHVNEELSRKLHVPKKTRPQAPWLTVDELKRFVNTPSEPRLACAWGLLAWCGLRRGELFKLQWQDIKLDDDVIIIRKAKGGKDRTLPLSEELKYRIRDFWGLQLCPTEGRVFGKWGINRFMREFREHIANAELENITPRTLRHTFATHLVRNGVSLMVVRELMGHTDIGTTMIYAHNDPMLMKDAMQKFPV